MLLRLLITILVLLWIYQAIKPMLNQHKPDGYSPPPNRKSNFDKLGEYTDYEEIKSDKEADRTKNTDS